MEILLSLLVGFAIREDSNEEGRGYGGACMPDRRAIAVPAHGAPAIPAERKPIRGACANVGDSLLPAGVH
jgi:hypothetical protein